MLPLNDEQIGVGIFSRGGSLYLQKWAIQDFPNSLFGIPNLEDAGSLNVYMRAVKKLVHSALSMRNDAAVEVVKPSHVNPSYDGVPSSAIALSRKAFHFFHLVPPSRKLTQYILHVFQARSY